MNPSVPLSPHAQPSHGIELFSLYVYPAGVCSLPHSPQERRGVRKVENSRVAFRRSFIFGASQLCGRTRSVGSRGVQVEKRSRVEGCDPGSSLGHAHPHGGATTSSASANGCCGKTFPRARRRHCCPPCMCWPCACCCALTYACRSLSLSARPQRMCLPAVQDAAGAAEKSKIQEWPLYEVSRSGLLVTLERACEGQRFAREFCVFGL